MKALVTGGCGFIGSHIVDRLIKEDFEVTVIDNLSTGRLLNLEHHKANPKLKVHIIDLADYEKILPLFEGIDWVFHIAALADIVPSIERPLEYHRANVDGTINVLECCRKWNVKRIIMLHLLHVMVSRMFPLLLKMPKSDPSTLMRSQNFWVKNT